MSLRTTNWAWDRRGLGEVREGGRHGHITIGGSDRKIVLLAIANNVGEVDYCTTYIDLAHIVEQAEASESAVVKAILALEALDLVAVYCVYDHTGHQLANRYVLNLDGLAGQEWREYADRWAIAAEALLGHRAVNRKALPGQKLHRTRSATQQSLFPRARGKAAPTRAEAPLATLPSLPDVADEDARTWLRARNELHQQMRQEDYTAWIEHLDLWSHDGPSWVFAAANPATVEWLQAKLTGSISRTIQSLTGGPSDVAFIVRPPLQAPS